MTITSTDLTFFGADQPVDTIYGGGRITGTVVANGVDNNVFPNVSLSDRSGGRVQMRKVYAAVVSENADVLLGAQVSLKATAADASTDVLLFAYGDQSTNRGAAATAVAALPYTRGALVDSLTSPIGTDQFNIEHTVGIVPVVGELLWIGTPTDSLFNSTLTMFAAVTAVDDHTTYYTITLDRDLPAGGNSFAVYHTLRVTTVPRCYGAAALTATSGTDTVVLDRVEAQLVPSMASYPTAVNLIDPLPLKPNRGKVPIFRAGDAVVLRNGATEEVGRVAFVDYTGGLTFEDNLAHSYPSGSIVSSLLDLDDMAAAIAASFSQQTWTRTFSDVLIGNPIAANYDRAGGSITTDNLGGATERWAIVFTSATAFKLIGEAAGQIATGDTATDFSPTNPLTGASYFTIAATGWGSGWGIGNVLRFNTVGARAPFWYVRTVSPSTPGSDDAGVLELRGSV